MEEVRRFLAKEFNIQPQKLVPQANLENDLLLDELGLVELSDHMKKFLQISDDLVDAHPQTVEDIAKFYAKYSKSQRVGIPEAKEDVVKEWLLQSRPRGVVDLSNFKLVKTPKQPWHSGLLVKTLWISVDPYLRPRMNPTKSYQEPFHPNDVLDSFGIGRVLKSSIAAFKEGDLLVGLIPWRTENTFTSADLQKWAIKKVPNGINPTDSLSVLGMTGLTSYFGITEIGQPKPGETVVITGAAGAVGSVAGQIAKILGCRVVGTAGSQEKIDYLVNELKFDAAINYKKDTSQLAKELQKACPNGVGGPASDIVWENLNFHARVILCGSIHHYNDTSVALVKNNNHIIMTRSVKIQGFIVHRDYGHKYKEGTNQMTKWLQEGKIKSRTTVVEGFENIPQAFLDMLRGANIGKMLVKCAE